jgi:hypothetical protein
MVLKEKIMERNVINGQILAADPISGMCLLRTPEGKEYKVSGLGSKLLLQQGQKEIGTIVRTSVWSGSVWINGDCIGEYSRVSGEYIVTPIREGLLELDNMRHVHPIDFLVQRY